MGDFKKWLLKEDIFGFEQKVKYQNTKSEPCDQPIVNINSDLVVEYMMSQNIRGMKPKLQFSNQVQWGEETGAIRIKLSPIGSFKIFIRKLQPNLEGTNIWVCKKILEFKELVKSNDSICEQIASSIFDLIEEIESQSINAVNPEYKGLEGLTRKLAANVSRRDIMPSLFIYKGVYPAKEQNNWLVVFECRGHGVEAPEGNRLEQFNIDMSYNPKTGMIRSFGQNIESPVKGHRWYPQPSEWDEYFSSGQSEKEIIEAISVAFKTF